MVDDDRGHEWIAGPREDLRLCTQCGAVFPGAERCPKQLPKPDFKGLGAHPGLSDEQLEKARGLQEALRRARPLRRRR